MKISKRQREIMEILLNRHSETTVAEIAGEIKVSSRTVHRELQEIEAVLETFGVTVLKKAGIGIQIQAERKQLEQLKADLFLADPEEYTSEERKVLILCKLLESDEPIKLFSLSHDLQAAIPTISGDLDEMEGWVRKNGLMLIRKRGYGVEIAGTEQMKRQSISMLAQAHLDDSILFGSDKETHSDPVTRQLLGMVGKDHFFRLEKALWKLEEQYPTSLTEGAYTHLLIRLSIGLTRFRQGKRMQWEQHGEEEWGLSGELQRKVECFAETLELKLPPEEMAYVMDLLKDWENGGQGQLIHEDLQQMEWVTRLIRHVGDQLAADLLEDRSLTEGLLLHVNPALHRIRNGEPIRNPLLAQIKRDYEQLFEMIKSAVRESAMEFPVPDEEIGYLVMHFGAALERIRQFSRRVRALLVCTSGIGSTKLLAVRIKKELPQIELLGQVSWFEALRIPEDSYDLVISTVDLPLPPEQYMKLSPLLTQNEAEKLRAFIQNITLKRIPAHAGLDEPKAPSLNVLRNVNMYSQEIVRLIEQIQVHPVALPPSDGQRNLRPIVEEMCGIAHRHYGLEQVDDIVERLLKREELGSQVIPDSGLALFHTRSETIPRPILALFRFDSPLQWQELHGQQVERILLMLGPKEMAKETLEVLSEVSAMLLEPDVIRRLERDDEESIKRFFTVKFEHFLKSKLEWRD